MYEYKYRKYKSKYLDLKKRQNGGGTLDIDKIMYISVGGVPQLNLYIPEHRLVGNIQDILKNIVVDNGLSLETLLEFSKNNKQKYETSNDPITKYTHIDNLPELYDSAKQILKAYLPQDEINYDDNKKWFQRKDEILRRLFSHNYEKKLVESKQQEYNKIIFPERVFLVKDSNNNRLSRDDTVKFIDTYFKLFIDYKGEIYFDFVENNYKMFNYTTYIEEEGRKQPPSLEINHQVYDQVIKLCNELGTVDYTVNNVHYEDGIVYIKDLKNKGQYRCPQKEEPVKKEENTWLQRLLQDLENQTK